MAGIYLPGMEMPTIEPLILKINPDGSVSTTWKNGYKKYAAIPIPDHGRLIDADKFFRSFPELRPYDFVAPTIIEADKEEDP